MSEAIVCHAVVYNVKTLVDKSPRITLDLPETEIMQMALFAECQRMQVVLEITAMPMESSLTNGDTADGKKSRHETKSLRGN
jgi:hypothetical protein